MAKFWQIPLTAAFWARTCLTLTALLLVALIAAPALPANAAPAAVTAPAACRTALSGDQTAVNLVDSSQFVPVSQLTSGTTSTAVASPVAPSPAALATPVANPDSADTASLRALTFAVINCTSQRDFDTLGALVTDTYLRDTFAGGNKLSRTDLLELAALTVVPQQRLLSFGNVAILSHSATAEVIYTSGQQILHEEWGFVTGDDGWLLDHVSALEPVAHAESAISNVTITTTIKTDPREVKSGNVVLLGTNKDRADHEMLVLRLPAGTTTDVLLRQAGPNLPDGVAFIGQMTVPAGGTAALPLIDLAAGNYVIVDMLLDTTGSPYLASGYKARLIVSS